MRAIRTRFDPVLFAVLFATACLGPGSTRAEPFVVSTSQVCVSDAGECETGSPVFGRGAWSQLSRSWGDSNEGGFYFLAHTDMRTDFAAFAGSARASGYDIPSSGGDFSYGITRIARSFATFSDTVTAGADSGAGYLRLPLEVAGQVLVSWQNGFGYGALTAGCQSNEPGSPLALGNCPPLQFIFTENEAIDTVVDLDVPILLGAPVEFRVHVTVSAATGHGIGPTPFHGFSDASFATRPFRGALVLDAAKNPIPGATITSESGFAYAPEPGAGASGGIALLSLAGLTMARRTSCRTRAARRSSNWPKTLPAPRPTRPPPS